MKILPEKIRKRIQIHTSLESLHNHIGKSILPKYLGGLLEDEEALDREMVNELVQTDKIYDGRSNIFKHLQCWTLIKCSSISNVVNTTAFRLLER
jgi:hypothetical protein